MMRFLPYIFYKNISQVNATEGSILLYIISSELNEGERSENNASSIRSSG
jgi:hypothetical protein